MAKRKLTKAERAEREAEYERVLANVRRTRELAEKAQAKLDARSGRGQPESRRESTAKKQLTKPGRAEREAERQRVLENARRTRELAERAQAKLDARSERGRAGPLA